MVRPSPVNIGYVRGGGVFKGNISGSSVSSSGDMLKMVML